MGGGRSSTPRRFLCCSSVALTGCPWGWTWPTGGSCRWAGRCGGSRRPHRLGGASGPWPFGGLYFHVDADTQDAGRPVFVLQTPSEGYVAGGADLSADLERLLCLQPVGSFVRGQAGTCLGRPPSLAVNPNAKAPWLVNREAAPWLRARTPRSSRQAGIRVTVRNAAQPWLPPPCTDDVPAVRGRPRRGQRGGAGRALPLFFFPFPRCGWSRSSRSCAPATGCAW